MQVLPYRYNPITGDEFYADVRKIRENEQFNYLLEADKKYPLTPVQTDISAEQHLLNAASHQKGYCISWTCNKNGSYSIASPHVNYHCLKCLANILCRSRDNSTLAEIDVQFSKVCWKAAEPPLKIRFNSGIAYINGRRVQGYFRGNIFIVEKGFAYPRAEARALMIGRHCCKNRIMSALYPDWENTCVSDEPHCFRAYTVPEGIPTWWEKDNGNPGMVSIYEYCYSCDKKYRIKK